MPNKRQGGKKSSSSSTRQQTTTHQFDAFLVTPSSLHTLTAPSSKQLRKQGTTVTTSANTLITIQELLASAYGNYVFYIYIYIYIFKEVYVRVHSSIHRQR